MLLGIGNKVRFLHTGTEGKIVDHLEDGMFIVDVGNGVEIPASPEHLERVDRNLDQSSVKAKVISAKTEQPVNPMPFPERQYEILKSEGIQIAFELLSDGSMHRYGVFLLNDTQYQALYELEIKIKGQSIKKLNGKVDPVAFLRIMEMPADYLSDNPVFHMSCRQVSTEGMSDWLVKELKLKPKQFFARKKTAPLLGRQAHVYKLFEPYQLKDKSESLKKYTQKEISKKPIRRPRSINYKEWGTADVQKYANFPLEKDLHIEKIIGDHSKMSNGEILRTQLNAFNHYIDQAVRLGIPKVFVIHGHGKGKLKNEIATLLMQHPNVRTFKNEYHPKYGTGATEVILD